MKKKRATSGTIDKSHKTPTKKLLLILLIMPFLVVSAAIVVYLFFPASAQTQTSSENFLGLGEDSEIQSIIDEINIDIEAPTPESQEDTKQSIAERQAEKTAKEAEKKRLEEEAFSAKKKALEIAQAREDARNKICFIGDSITAGGHDNQRGAADRAIDILNSGHPADDLPYDRINIASGGSTAEDWRGSIALAIGECNKPNLKMIMIMLGTNDAGWRVPTSEYISNMNYIRSVASGMSAPVIVNCPIQLRTMPEGQALTTAYCAELRANGVSESLDLPLSDNIHPTSDGYDAIASRWAEIIKSWVGV
jgi:hypothetical protein